VFQLEEKSEPKFLQVNHEQRILLESELTLGEAETKPEVPILCKISDDDR